MAFALLPKDTVLAAIGGAVLETANTKIASDSPYKEEYVEYGQMLLTTAVIAIVITAPLGAILINTLSTKWLHHDEEEIENLPTVSAEDHERKARI